MSSRTAKNRLGAQKKSGFKGVLTVLAVIAVVLVGLCLGLAALLSSWFRDLPDYEKADAFNTAMPTYVYAADGKTVLARFQLEYREPVELDQISELLSAAVIATEDARFYEHSGVDYVGVARALVNNLTGGSLEGASTITQQFVRNTILADEMDDISIKRKVREAYIAMQLEKQYSKDDILQMYLNTINFGAGAYGAEAAAQRYFSKHAADLTLTEAALLAGIPQSPTYNDPLQYPSQALERRNKVLGRMLDENVITQQEHDEAVAQPLGLEPKELQGDGIVAYPYFTSYVRDLLYNEYDLSEADVLKGGLKVYTTLDIGRQEAAEEACRLKREGMYSDAMEVAMAVVDPATGYVQAIVGGADYNQSQVNLATGQGGGGRPCGSVFKMFTLATAVKENIDPYSTYVDCTSPATIDGYTLENYGNASYGTRSIAGAFAVSSNTGFVRIISALGVKKVAEMAHALGVTTDLYEDDAGAALTLGVQNITPLELANATATIANGGIHHQLCAVTTIEDREGRVIVDNTDVGKHAERVLTKEEAYAIQRVMEGVVTGGTGTAAALYNGQSVGGKTGTSEDYKDISFVGFTPYFAASIWVGDPTNAAAVPTGTCADVFHNFATEVFDEEKLKVQKFQKQEDPHYERYENERYNISYYPYGYTDPSQVSSSSASQSSDAASSGSSTKKPSEGTGTDSKKSQDSTSKPQDTGGASGGGANTGGDSGSSTKKPAKAA